MMKLNLIFTVILFGLLSTSIKAQEEKIELSEVCYFEEIGAAPEKYSFKPYFYHDRLELKFESDYQITIKLEDKEDFVAVIDRFEEFHEQSIKENNNGPQLIDNFSPEIVSHTKKVADPSKMIKIYYCKELRETGDENGNLIINIPDLTDMFGGETAPEKYLYFSRECVSELLEVLKSN